MPTFLELNMSTRKDKKMVFKMENPKRTIHFGSKTSRTYVEGASKEDRLNYIKRHKVRENWDMKLMLVVYHVFFCGVILCFYLKT